MNTEAKDWLNPVNVVSDFRLWCERKWQEHLIETESFGEKINYTREEYLSKQKYWLKSEYKRRQNEDV